MASIADQLMERRASLITQAQEIAQRGVTDGRDLTVEEQSGFDKMILMSPVQGAMMAATRSRTRSARSPARSRRNSVANGSPASASGLASPAPETLSPST